MLSLGYLYSLLKSINTGPQRKLNILNIVVTRPTTTPRPVYSRTNWVSRYQKGKTSLDLNEARDSGVLGFTGISWTICKQSAPLSRQINTSSRNFYRPDALPDWRTTNSVKALKTDLEYCKACDVCKLRELMVERQTGSLPLLTVFQHDHRVCIQSTTSPLQRWPSVHFVCCVSSCNYSFRPHRIHGIYAAYT